MQTTLNIKTNGNTVSKLSLNTNINLDIAQEYYINKIAFEAIQILNNDIKISILNNNVLVEIDANLNTLFINIMKLVKQIETNYKIII